jgi:hypothetical protein
MNRREFLRRALMLGGSTAFLPLVMVAPREQEPAPLLAAEGVQVWQGGVQHNVVVMRSDTGALAVLHSPDDQVRFTLGGE